MMKEQYIFSVLRYTFDQVTQEFVNVGIAVYAPQSRTLEARVTQHYGRISDMFEVFDGVRLRHTLRFVQDSINEMASDLTNRLAFKEPGDLHELLNRVLPIDDSSLQFVKAGVGITDDLGETVVKLFERYVERYSQLPPLKKRDDEDVWRSFRASLDRRNLTKHLVPKTIVAKNFDYQFERSWKNGIWHIYEPLSFDFLDGGSIAEKANRWVGRATGLEDSEEKFELHLLLGPPSDPRLQTAFQKAENLLHKMPVKHELVLESQAEAFARELAFEIEAHGN